jgi:hypothetical protein
MCWNLQHYMVQYRVERLGPGLRPESGHCLCEPRLPVDIWMAAKITRSGSVGCSCWGVRLYKLVFHQGCRVYRQNLFFLLGLSNFSTRSLSTLSLSVHACIYVCMSGCLCVFVYSKPTAHTEVCRPSINFTTILIEVVLKGYVAG